MILPEIDPIALQIGPLSIRWYSLTWLMAFLSIYFLLSKRTNNLDSGKISDLMFYGMLGAIIGGRFGYMFFYGIEQLSKDPLSIFYVWQGGLSFHGGLMGVLVACYLLSRKWNVKFFWLMDMVAPCIPPGLGLVRIGNFLNSKSLRCSQAPLSTISSICRGNSLVYIPYLVIKKTKTHYEHFRLFLINLWNIEIYY